LIAIPEALIFIVGIPSAPQKGVNSSLFFIASWSYRLNNQYYSKEMWKRLISWDFRRFFNGLVTAWYWRDGARQTGIIEGAVRDIVGIMK
jgi:hypothetical protein